MVVLVTGGGETMVGVDSAVAVMITGDVGLTSGIVVGRTFHTRYDMAIMYCKTNNIAETELTQTATDI